MKQRSYDQPDTATIWIKGTTEWVNQWVSKGWQLYYVNFMFKPLLGPTAAVIPRMKKGINKFYGRFCTEFVHNGRAKSEQTRMPQLWLFPDLPVYKNDKSSLRDVTINGGLHYNGPMLIPPVSRFEESPIKYLEDNQAKYAHHGIERIHVVQGGDIPGLADYVAKTIRNGRANEEDIIILPRSVDQLPAKKRPVVDLRDRLLKDIQSALNVSDEVAHQMRNSIAKAA